MGETTVLPLSTEPSAFDRVVESLIFALSPSGRSVKDFLPQEQQDPPKKRMVAEASRSTSSTTATRTATTAANASLANNAASVPTLDSDPDGSSSSKEIGQAIVKLRRLDVQDLVTRNRQKTVYFVRHGESLWNEAQDGGLFWRMPGLFDAPLSSAGRRQCEDLAKVTRQMFRDSPPSVIFCSPLTRAIQTAVIGFQDFVYSTPLLLLPSAREKRGSIASVDSAGIAVGEDIINHVQTELQKLYAEQSMDGGSTKSGTTTTATTAGGGASTSGTVTATIGATQHGEQEHLPRPHATAIKRQRSDQSQQSSGKSRSPAVVAARPSVASLKRRGSGTSSASKMEAGEEDVVPAFVRNFRELQVDTKQVQQPWWTSWADSRSDLLRRLDDFMCQLIYSPYDNIAVVGHSHFFREIFRNYIHNELFTVEGRSDDAMKEDHKKTLIKKLCKDKISNAGMLKLTLRCDLAVDAGSQQRPISSAELCGTRTRLVGDAGIFGSMDMLRACRGPTGSGGGTNVRLHDAGELVVPTQLQPG
ncbi:unnamed protein product [Amoebophrya sp. A25]|nr:unnamed protein product [Amoebophrya sp. A25]|eukprot:GSA25T00014065001.1